MSYTIPIASLSLDSSGRIVTSSTTYQDFSGTAAPALSAAGHGRIYFDFGTNLFKMSQNGGAYTTLGGGGGGGTVDAGTANRFAIYPSNLAEVGDTYINNGFNVILTGPTTVMGQSTTFSLNDPQISQAKIWTATNAAPSINSIVTTNNIGNMVTTNVINSSISLNSNAINNLGNEDFIGTASPGISASGHGKLYFDSTSNKMQISENGGGFVNLYSPISVQSTVSQIGFITSPGAMVSCYSLLLQPGTYCLTGMMNIQYFQGTLSTTTKWSNFGMSISPNLNSFTGSLPGKNYLLWGWVQSNGDPSTTTPTFYSGCVTDTVTVAVPTTYYLNATSSYDNTGTRQPPGINGGKFIAYKIG